MLLTESIRGDKGKVMVHVILSDYDLLKHLLRTKKTLINPLNYSQCLLLYKADCSGIGDDLIREEEIR